MDDYKITGPGLEVKLTRQEMRRLMSSSRSHLNDRKMVRGLTIVELSLQQKLTSIGVV